MMPTTNTCTSVIEPDQFAALYRVVASCFEVAPEQLTAETLLLEDLGVDSIDLLALAIELEEEFDIVISDQTLFRIRKIGDIYSCVADGLELRRNGREALLVYHTIGESPTR